ncbi:MAG TPA: tetratricopeptide repeat protein [Ohtaekwangia sp.]
MKSLCAVVLVVFFCSAFQDGLSQQAKTDSLLRVIPGMEKSSERVDALNELAFHFAIMSPRDSEKFVEEALALARDIQYKKGLAESLKILGVIYYSRSEFSLSAEYSYQALKLFEELGDKSGQGKVLNNLALVFSAQHEVEKLYEFSQRSLRLKRAVGDSVGVANSLLSLVDYYRQTKKFDQAQRYCKEALARYHALHNDLGLAHASRHMGEVYADEHNYVMSASYFKDAIHFAKLANDHFEIMGAYRNLGHLFLHAGGFDSAQYYYRKSLQQARQYGSQSHEMLANQGLSSYYSKLNQFDSALFYFQAATTIERTIFNSEKLQQLSALQILYDFERKEQEIGFHKKIVQRQYVAIIGVTAILILTVMIGFKFYYLNRTNLRAKEDLLKLNTEIHSMNENLEQLVQKRTEEIKLQNQRLVEYAFFTAHEVRGPLARILGLIELAKLKDISSEDKDQIMARLEDTANELDEVIRVINRKLENARQKL